LPILWLGWVRLSDVITLRLRTDHRAIAMAVMIALPFVTGFGQFFGFIQEQRRCDLALFDSTTTRADRFYSYYRQGQMPLLKRMGIAIRNRSMPYDRILAPDANIVAYFSGGREVVGLRSGIAFRVPAGDQARSLADYRPTIVVFPGSLYRQADPNVAWMMRLKVIDSRLTILRSRDPTTNEMEFTLDRPLFNIPSGDWRFSR